MGFNATIEGVVTRKPEPVGVPAGDWTHSLDVQVQTGVRGGRAYFETFYVLAREVDVLAYTSFNDGEIRATITIAALWAGQVMDWSGQPRLCLCCTAGALSFAVRQGTR